MKRSLWSLILLSFAVSPALAEGIVVSNLDQVDKEVSVTMEIRNENHELGFFEIKAQCNFLNQGAAIAKVQVSVDEIRYRDSHTQTVTTTLKPEETVDSVFCIADYTCLPQDPACKGRRELTSEADGDSQDATNKPQLPMISSGGLGSVKNPFAANRHTTAKPTGMVTNSNLLSFLARLASPWPTGVDNAYRVVANRGSVPR